jgi:hypothetical protein
MIEDSDWQYGSKNAIQKAYSAAPEGGIICEPSALGCELFLWALGHSDKPLEFIFETNCDPAIKGIPGVIPNSTATKN